MTKLSNALARFFGSFKHNWGMKVLSVVFAVLLWNYVMTQTDPPRPFTVRDIAINFQGMSQLNSMGLTVKGDIGTYVKSGDVRLEIPRSSAVRRPNPADISLWLDVSGITTTGTHEVPVKNQTSRGTVVKVDPQSVRITVEKLESKIIAVDYSLTGTLPQGYWRQKTPTWTPTMIEIQGAKSDIDKIQKAQVVLSLDDLRADVRKSVEFQLVDDTGAVVPSAGIQMSSPNCLISMQVRPARTVTVTANNSLVGQLAQGYEQGEIIIYPSTVRLTATESDLLDSIQSVELEPLDIQGKSSDMTFTANLKLPPGVDAPDGRTVTVFVRVQPIYSDSSFTDLPVEVRNVGSDLTVMEKKITANVVVNLPQIQSAQLSASQIGLYVDAFNLGPGTHELPLKAAVQTREGVRSVTSTPEYVQVTLVKK